MIISYYGRLDVKLIGKPLGYFMIDDIFKGLLEKHEERMIHLQNKLLAKMKKDNEDTFNMLNKSIKNLTDKISELEKKKEKGNKYADVQVS